ncbi:methyltransferase-like protein 25 isoform X2 [Cyprinus carpio]|uniref:Methyltransferase-like protein 25 isoform X2 n=1 Tax=Cyprinus carpio TaxID=7962 RepID=A0A9Q9W6P5_CYPCA|nr:methyltransferase-like protein 25 isoform X2 [Cyprinus carpio]
MRTLDFYTRDVWSTFMCVSPDDVLCAIIRPHEGDRSNASMKLVDISALLRAAKAHCLPALGVCMQLEDLMQNLRLMTGDTTAGCVDGVCGFPVSQYLKAQACFCGRNARMSACLALERVSAGEGINHD